MRVGPRRLNRSLAWREVEAAKLAQTPECERCGTRAVEAHNTDGDCSVSPPYSLEAVESLCKRCHDETTCTVYRETGTDRRLQEMLDNEGEGDE